MDTAKLFWSGRSQAVRLPRAYRLDGDQVRIRRVGASIVLDPITTDWAWLDALGALDPAEADFMATREQPDAQPRAGLDDVFGA